jgi:hypothetical protein
MSIPYSGLVLYELLLPPKFNIRLISQFSCDSEIELLSRATLINRARYPEGDSS